MQLLLKPMDYGFIAIGIVVLVLIVFFTIKLSKKQKNKNKQVALVSTYEALFDALGRRENILDVSIEHKRLKVKVKDIKSVKTNILKELEIPAVLTGNELKLLVKENAEEIFNFLKNNKGGLK
jgi:phosphotransferase system IIB component